MSMTTWLTGTKNEAKGTNSRIVSVKLGWFGFWIAVGMICFQIVPLLSPA